MISRFDILFLLLFSTVALPWGIMIFNAEKELIALEPATAELEDYYYDFEGNKFDTPDEYVKAVADKGGDVAKAKAVSENPIFEADLAKIDKKSGVVLIKGRRNKQGESAYPLFRGGSALRGKRIYEANGCVQCHTQQVRRPEYGSDIAKGFGKRHSVARDYIHDDPVLVGRLRIGPDLANVGDRKDKSDLHKHIYRPASGSSMPAYPHLYKLRRIRGGISENALNFESGEYGAPQEGYEVIPTERANDLVSYLSSLKQDYELPEVKFPGGGSANGESGAVESGGGSQVFAKGKKLYNTPGACATCHQPNGQGLETANFPPLANSEWVTGSEEVVVRIVLHGVQGPLKVGDKQYGLVPMVPTIWASWSDDDIAAVVSYIRNYWGNEAPEVSRDTVKRIRDEVGARGPWKAEELEEYK
jgi:cytochrome c oxidase cbb3-type subunit 2